MATAAELVIAPGAARPETAAARKDTPAAAGETSFAEVLDAEVQTPGDTDVVDAPVGAAATAGNPAQTQLAAPPALANTIEWLISLQSADAPVAPPEVADAEGTPAAPKAVPAVAPMVTPEIGATATTPAEAPTPALQADTTTALTQAPTEPETMLQAVAADVVTPAVAMVAPEAVQEVVSDTVGEPAAETDSKAPAAESSPNLKATTVAADPAPVLAPAENVEAAAASATTALGQAAIAAAAVPAPKPTAPKVTEIADQAAPKDIPGANRTAPASETPATSPKPEAPAPNSASASQAPNNGVKPQAGVQTVAADPSPAAKPDAPAPASSSTSISFADLLAGTRGAPADAGKPAAHPALQSAPQAVVQVYTRFVERFDGRAQRFEVSLTPAELGRVDVRIEIGADRKVHAVLAAHDSAALTDLMRGQRALERALMDAGVDLKDGGVKFELANDPGRSHAGEGQRRDARSGEDQDVWRGFSAVDVAVETDAPAAVRSYRSAARLDLVA